MLGLPANLAYHGRGNRTYGLRPVFGRARGFWELQWVFAGGARPCRADRRVFPGRPPCLYLSHPDSPHGWTDDGANASEVAVLHFRTVPAELVARVKATETLIVELREAEPRQHLARLAEIWAMLENEDGRVGLKLAQVLIEVTLLVLGREAAPAPLRGGVRDRVAEALHWFEENLCENPSADAVARAVGVSPAHLRRLFAEAGRAAPREEMARLRMAAARRCLREGWKLEKIAAHLGFSEASAFSRAFSATCGESPRKWLATARRVSGGRSGGGPPEA